MIGGGSRLNEARTKAAQPTDRCVHQFWGSRRVGLAPSRAGGKSAMSAFAMPKSGLVPCALAHRSLLEIFDART